MVTKEQALKEMAKRELVRRQQQPQMSPPGRQPEPTIIEETHPEVSFGDRAIIKNFGNDPESAAQYLQQKNPNLEVKNHGDKMLIRSKGEKDYRVLDPDTGFFSSDFLEDTTDVAYDVGSGLVEGAGAVAAGVSTMNPLAAFGANAALGAGNETVRQYLGKKLGVNKELDGGEIALVGGLSGALPGVFDAAKAGYKAAAKTGKGALKFITGVTDDNIDVLRQTPNVIKEAEEKGVVGRLQGKADAINKLADSGNRQVAEEIARVRSSYNVANDDDVLKVLGEEVNTIQAAATREGRALKPQEMAKIGDLQYAMDTLGETSSVRQVVSETGEIAPDAVRQQAFPDTLNLDDAMQMMPVQVKEGLQGAFDEVSEKYAQMAGKQVMVPTEVINSEFKAAIGRAGTGLGTKQQQQLADLLTREYNQKFKIPNKLETVTTKYKGGSNVTPYTVSKEVDSQGRPLTDVVNENDMAPAIRQTDPRVATVTGQKGYETYSNPHTVKGQQQVRSLDEMMGMGGGSRPVSNDPFLELPEEVTLEAFQGLKSIAATGAGYDQALNNKIGRQAATELQKFYRGLERTMTEQLNISTLGDNAAAGSQYKKVFTAQKEMKKMFNTDASAKATINKALKGDVSVLRKLKEFDELVGTDMATQIEQTIKANEATKKGLQQAKLFTDSSELATKQAKETVGGDVDLVNKLRERTGDVRGVQKTLADIRSGGDPELNSMVKTVQEKYGAEAGESVEQLVKEMDAINYFADPKNFDLFGLGGKEGRGRVESVGGGVGGALGWSLGVGAQGAQFGSNVGKAIGSSAKVRQYVKSTLEKSFKTDDALRKMDKQTQEWLKKEVMGRVTQGDLLREGTKTAVDASQDRP